MDELKKIRRVMGKAMDDAPHEVLLVLDGNTGQNMLAQVQAFDEAVQLTGLIVTKLDGNGEGRRDCRTGPYTSRQSAAGVLHWRGRRG